jgi:hypothetical protein
MTHPIVFASLKMDDISINYSLGFREAAGHRFKVSYLMSVNKSSYHGPATN